MKTFTVPKPVKVRPSLAPSGQLDFASFVRELVFTNAGWRARGKAELLLEIDEKLDEAVPDKPLTLTDEAHEILCQEASFPGQQIRWDLAPAVAVFQQAIFATATKAADK